MPSKRRRKISKRVENVRRDRRRTLYLQLKTAQSYKIIDS